MGWENRNGKRYYYRKTWVNGTCRSEYIQVGLGEIIGQLDQLDIERRLWERYEYRQELEQLARLDGPVDEFCAAVNQIVEAVLLATGHHKPKRQWRRKRQMATPEEIGEAVSRIYKDKPKKDDLEMVKKAIQETPDSWSLFGGDIDKNAIRFTIQKMSGDKPSGQLLETALTYRVRALKSDFGYQDSSPIEKLLIDQICLSWLRLYWVENTFSQNIQSSTSTTLILYYEKRLTFSQIRFTRAIETLAKIRRLARRTPEILQVNIAENQVNTVATQTTPR